MTCPWHTKRFSWERVHSLLPYHRNGAFTRNGRPIPHSMTAGAIVDFRVSRSNGLSQVFASDIGLFIWTFDPLHWHPKGLRAACYFEYSKVETSFSTITKTLILGTTYAPH